MASYSNNGLFVGQRIGKMTITLLGEQRFQLLCDCGNVESQQNNQMPKQMCKECRKDRKENINLGGSQEAGVELREYTKQEEDRIELFEARRAKAQAKQDAIQKRKSKKATTNKQGNYTASNVGIRGGY